MIKNSASSAANEIKTNKKHTFVKVAIATLLVLVLYRCASLIITQYKLSHGDYQYGTYGKSVYSSRVVIVDWNSSRGLKILENAEYKNDFYQLAHNFEPQADLVSCGIASGVMALNTIFKARDSVPINKQYTLKIETEKGQIKSKFRQFTQPTFLNSITNKVKDESVVKMLKRVKNEAGEEVFDPGLQLEDLAEMLEDSYGLNVEKFHVNNNEESDLNEFKQNLKNYLNDKSKLVIANFQSKDLGFAGSGHFSPIAAYNSDEGYVLLLDPAAYRNPWTWVKVEDFLKSMNTKDGAKNRGYLVVGR